MASPLPGLHSGREADQFDSLFNAFLFFECIRHLLAEDQKGPMQPYRTFGRLTGVHRQLGPLKVRGTLIVMPVAGQKIIHLEPIELRLRERLRRAGQPRFETLDPGRNGSGRAICASSAPLPYRRPFAGIVQPFSSAGSIRFCHALAIRNAGDRRGKVRVWPETTDLPTVTCPSADAWGEGVPATGEVYAHTCVECKVFLTM